MLQLTSPISSKSSCTVLLVVNSSWGHVMSHESLHESFITLWWTNRLQWKMAIEIVDFPIKSGDFPWQNVSSPEGQRSKSWRISSGPSFFSTRTRQAPRSASAKATIKVSNPPKNVHAVRRHLFLEKYNIKPHGVYLKGDWIKGRASFVQEPEILQLSPSYGNFSGKRMRKSGWRSPCGSGIVTRCY